MKVECIHGYFKFRDRETGDVARFNSLYGFGLSPKDDYATFPFLLDAPEHSFISKTYLGLAARVKYAGHPWEVMRANQFVYDFGSGELKKIEDITIKATVNQAGFYYVTNGLLLPGSILPGGLKVTDYECVFAFSTSRFMYSRVTAE